MSYTAVQTSEVVLGSDQTTVGAGELTALTTTLTNPQNPGRAFVSAAGTLKSSGATVAGDTFDVRLYKDATIICTETVKVTVDAGGGANRSKIAWLFAPGAKT